MLIDVSSVVDATKDERNKNETPKATPDIIELVKDLTPSSTPGEDESIITRASECSDDSNLIKLDLSQLVGDPNIASEDAADNKLKDHEEGDMKSKRSSRSTSVPVSSKIILIVTQRNCFIIKKFMHITTLPSPILFLTKICARLMKKMSYQLRIKTPMLRLKVKTASQQQ